MRRHHWPKEFWARFGNKGKGHRLPIHLGVKEAIELGMYDADRTECKGLLVNHPTCVDSDGTPKQVVLCVPWKTKGEGRSQYSASGEESKASEDQIEHTGGVAAGPGAGTRKLVDDRAPVPPPPMTKRFHTLNPESCRQHFGYRNRK